MALVHEPRQHDDGVGCACGKDWPCPTLRQQVGAVKDYPAQRQAEAVRTRKKARAGA